MFSTQNMRSARPVLAGIGDKGLSKGHSLDIIANKYTLFDGLAYNTSGYFASCVVFFRAPQG